MKNMDFRVLGGFYFSLEYIFDQLQNIFQNNVTDDFFELTISFFDILSASLDVVFIILFFGYISRKRKIIFLQKFMNNFPKTTMYLYYIGFIGYILFAINLFIMLPIYFFPNEVIQKNLIYGTAAINVIGYITAFVLASRKVFSKKTEVS